MQANKRQPCFAAININDSNRVVVIQVDSPAILRDI
jgi:hypothetical protein